MLKDNCTWGKGHFKLALVYLVLALLFSSCHRAPEHSGPGLVEIDCSIYPIDGEEAFKLFPGSLCEYDGEGFVYSAFNKSLTKYSFQKDEVLWSVDSDVINHDMAFDSERKLLFSIERSPYLKDGISVLGAKIVGRNVSDGSFVWEWREVDHLEDIKKLSILYQKTWQQRGPNRPNADDLSMYPEVQSISMEFNQVDVVNSKSSLLNFSPEIKPGDLFVNLREKHVMAVIDFKTGKFVWSQIFQNALGQVHTVSFLGAERVLYFSNLDSENPNRSAAIEYDFERSQEKWRFSGSAADSFFYPIFASVQQLSSGARFIVDNTEGQENFLMVGDQGEVLWKRSYRNYHYPKHMKVYRARVTHINDYF